MSKNDILRKISSRKFWVCLIGFVSSILVAFNVGENQIAQVTAVITAFGSLIVYMLTEGATDIASIKSSSTITSTTITESKNVNMESKLSAKQADTVAKTLSNSSTAPTASEGEELKSESTVVASPYEDDKE